MYSEDEEFNENPDLRDLVVIQGCYSAWIAEILLFGSSCKQFVIKEIPSLLTLLSDNLQDIWSPNSIDLIDLTSCGKLPVNRRWSITPIEYISTLLLYGLFLSISGAIYPGVPPILSSISLTAWLKSAMTISILSLLLRLNKFLGTISLWIIPF